MILKGKVAVIDAQPAVPSVVASRAPSPRRRQAFSYWAQFGVGREGREGDRVYRRICRGRGSRRAE